MQPLGKTPGQRLLLPPNLRRFRNPRGRLRGEEGVWCQGTDGRTFSPRAGVHTPPKKLLQGDTRGHHQSAPDQHHCQLIQEETRASLGCAVPPSHIFPLLEVNIWGDNNSRTIEKGVLSNFLTFAHKKHLKWQKVVTHRLLRCHPRFPAETRRERCVSRGEGQEHPRQNYNNLAPGLIASALRSSASATKKEERHSGLPVSSCKILSSELSGGTQLRE